MLPSLERVRELFDYDAVNGILHRKFNLFGRVLARGVKVDGVVYPVANIVWLHYYGIWPSKIIDHEDRDHLNIKISNLREATYQQNGYNTLKFNPYGWKGVYLCGRLKKSWQAQIRINGIKVNLGRFETIEEAAEAYIFAALEHHGDFACLETT